MSASSASNVDFWFDPICPWAWTTSRWVVRAADERGFSVTWRAMSLAVLNETDQEPYAEFNSITIGPARVCAAVEHSFSEKLGDFYTALGHQIHHQGDWLEAGRSGPFEELMAAYSANRGDLRKKVVAALAEVGLPGDLADAMTDEQWDGALTESHDLVPAPDANRELIGVPTISVDGSAGLFGPVIADVPPAGEAGELWDAFVTMARTPYFYELKRTTDRQAPLSRPDSYPVI